MIDEDFRTALVGLLPSGTPIEKGVIGDEQTPTRVYYQRSSGNQDVYLDGAPGLTTTVFDVEAAALADDTTVQSLMATIKTMHGYPANGVALTHGTSSILGIFVADHADDYQPRGVDADDGYVVAAVQISVTHL